MNLTKHWAAQLDDYAMDLAWSSGGGILAAASSAGPIALFARADGARRHELPGHENGTNSIAFAPASDSSDTREKDGHLLASAGQDGCVKFWDATAGQHTATAKLGSAWVEHVAWGPTNPVLAASSGKKLILLNPDGSTRRAFPDAPKTIFALAWEPKGGCLAAAGFGGVRLWDTDDFALQKELAYANGIHALIWSPDGKWLVSGNQDPSVHLWIPDEDLEFHMSGYESKVKHLSFDHTGRWLATGGGRDACLWDCSGAGPEGREPAMFPHDSPLCGAAFQHTHGLLATASQEGEVKLWSPQRQQPLRATVRMPGTPTKLAWSPDDLFLAIGSEKGVVYVLQCES